MNIKDQILNYPKLLRKDGKLNSNLLRPNSNFSKSKLYNDIQNYISSDVNLGIKIKLILLDLTAIPKCYCGNDVKYNGTTFNKYCSNKCSGNSSDVKEKFIETNLKKRGVKYPGQSIDVQKKCKQTTLATLGVEYPMQSKQILEKIADTKLKNHNNATFTNRKKAKDTCVSRYGVEHYSSTLECKEKIKQTSLDRYDVTHHSRMHISDNSLEILDSYDLFSLNAKKNSVSTMAHYLQVDTTTIVNYAEKYNCKDLFLVSIKSKWEELIAEYLTSLNVTYKRNTRKVISPLELDFYLPDYNIAIEINGNYWHSEIAGKKDKRYHYNKWKLCREQGIDLYSYFEDELINNFDIIKEKLQYITNNNKTVIGARKCIITDISYAQEREFLNTYHIQGESKARNKSIGAYYNDNLVAILSWQKKKHYLEITRYACDTKSSYPGLFSKMMKHMINELKYTGDIVSFSNNGHSNGKVYNASGFTIDKILGPSYWYLTNCFRTRENRQKYMKGKIKKKFKLSQEEIDSKTEWQLMQEQGYDRIWDSGKIKWLKIVK